MAEKINGRAGDAKLCYKNIKFVKVHTHNNIPYEWFVSLRGGTVSSFRTFFMGNVRGVVDSSAMYRFSELPSSVKAFIHNHDVNVFSEDSWGRVYIYR